MRSSLRRALVATALLSIAALLPAAPAAAQASEACPATFQVLHNDQIGKLKLRAGHYEVTVGGGLSCGRASQLFADFLQDFDGRLPRPWRVFPTTATFLRGGGPFGFFVTRVANPHGGGGGGHHPATGKRCPATFRVLHDDRIGRLRLPAGPYRITLLAVGKPSCARASKLFARFLEDFDGNLPRPWAVDAQTGTFRRGAANFGFRVKPAGG
jgi:hypothetical protein